MECVDDRFGFEGEINMIIDLKSVLSTINHAKTIKDLDKILV